MDFKKIKKTTIFLLAAIIVIVLCLFFLVKIKNENNPEPQDSRVGVSKENISPRNAQIDIYLEFPDEFSLAKFDNKIFHLVPYPKSIPIHKVQNFKEKPYGRSGVIVFEDKKIIWETQENLVDIIMDSDRFKDITNDNIPEIIVIDGGGGNVLQCIFYIYKWNGNKFNLITPEYVNPCEGSNPSDGGLIDIDGDNVFELISFRIDWMRPDTDLNDPYFNKKVEMKLIYKFNGSIYYLWKEEKVGDGTPVPAI